MTKTFYAKLFCWISKCAHTCTWMYPVFVAGGYLNKATFEWSVELTYCISFICFYKFNPLLILWTILVCMNKYISHVGIFIHYIHDLALLWAYERQCLLYRNKPAPSFGVSFVSQGSVFHCTDSCTEWITRYKKWQRNKTKWTKKIVLFSELPLKFIVVFLNCFLFKFQRELSQPRSI